MNIYVCSDVCMYAYIYMNMNIYVCMYVCMRVFVCMYIANHNWNIRSDVRAKRRAKRLAPLKAAECVSCHVCSCSACCS